MVSKPPAPPSMPPAMEPPGSSRKLSWLFAAPASAVKPWKAIVRPPAVSAKLPEPAPVTCQVVSEVGPCSTSVPPPPIFATPVNDTVAPSPVAEPPPSPLTCQSIFPAAWSTMSAVEPFPCTLTDGADVAPKLSRSSETVLAMPRASIETAENSESGPTASTAPPLVLSMTWTCCSACALVPAVAVSWTIWMRISCACTSCGMLASWTAKVSALSRTRGSSASMDSFVAAAIAPVAVKARRSRRRLSAAACRRYARLPGTDVSTSTASV